MVDIFNCHSTSSIKIGSYNTGQLYVNQLRDDIEPYQLQEIEESDIDDITDVYEEKVVHDFSIVLDGYSMRDKCPLVYINDCRKDMRIPHPTSEDNKYENIDYVTAYVRGWPQIFAITNRVIPAGTELLVNHRDYIDVLVADQQRNDLVRNFKKLIQCKCNLN